MKLCSAALLVAALAPALSVHAADTPSAFASASNFRFTLVDLDLNDGIAASLQFVPRAPDNDLGDAFAEAQHVHLRTGVEYSHRERQPTPWQAVSTSTALNDGAASLSASGAVSGSSLEELAITVKADADNPDGVTWAYGRASASLDFRLSPNTALSLSFDLNVNSTHPGVDAPGASESSIWASFGTWNDAQPYSENFRLSHALGADRYDAIGAAGSKTFVAQLASGAQARDLHFFVHASASTLTSPVPEPSTYGMMLAGLALVGAAARRKRKQP